MGSLIKESIAGSKRDFARLELSRAIPLLAIPMVLEMALESIFSLIDVFFVSKLGSDAITTVGLTESVITLTYAMSIGMSFAVTALVSRRLGEGKPEAASRVAGQALLLGLVVSVLLGLPAPLIADDLLRLMGASPQVVEVGWGYATVTLASNATIVLLFICNAVFHGEGTAGHAMRALWIANGVNLVLDPCLIFGLGPFPELGLTGAAIATSIGRGIGVLYQVHLLVRGTKVRLTLAALRPDFAELRRIVSLSVGGTGQYLIATASWIGLVRILTEFGSEVVAGYTVAIRIFIFVLMPSWGFANATSTLVGQSLGAANPGRAERVVLYSGLYNMGFLGLVSVVFIAAPEAVVGLLTNDAEVTRWAAQALRIISFGYVFYAWEMVLNNAFNGAGDTRTPMLINLLVYWAIELPLGWVLAKFAGMGPAGIFVAVASAYPLAAMSGYIAFRRGRWTMVRV